MYYLIKKIYAVYLIIFFISIPGLQASTFKIVSYNVENLFDLQYNGTEYQEYIPNTSHNWTSNIANAKYSNIARVLKEIDADIIALQEIESKNALLKLRQKLKTLGINYQYYAIAEKKNTTVKCAFLSKFPIIEIEEIFVNNDKARNILKLKFQIDAHKLIIFNNHWKSKSGPESLRIEYAKALMNEINKLNQDSDFILLGDFNANYNEYKTYRNSKNLNNTQGITGINHILRTVKNSELVSESLVFKLQNDKYLYNLWLELSPNKRWSYNFFGEKGSPDNIIISKGLYNNEGISYLDNSFDKFQKNYLFKNRAIYRWQKTRGRNGKHLGFGFSDHLPIYAYFTTKPFKFETKPTILNVEQQQPKKKKILKSGNVIDLNQASKEKLMTITGVGTILADRIISNRPYKTIEELLIVKGIGEKKLHRISPYIIVN